ncbi:MAG: hypothetical protein V7655_12710 [Aequorivita antarctica]
MKNFFKPARIGFYILMLLVCFILGLYFAAYIDAGKNQGLAGGAIVMGYGVLFAGIGLVASFFIAHFINVKTIIKINWILLVSFLSIFGYKYYQFDQRDKRQKQENEQFKPAPTTPTPQTEPIGMVVFYKK